MPSEIDQSRREFGQFGKRRGPSPSVDLEFILCTAKCRPRPRGGRAVLDIEGMREHLDGATNFAIEIRAIAGQKRVELQHVGVFVLPIRLPDESPRGPL